MIINSKTPAMTWYKLRSQKNYIAKLRSRNIESEKSRHDSGIRREMARQLKRKIFFLEGCGKSVSTSYIL